MFGQDGTILNSVVTKNGLTFAQRLKKVRECAMHLSEGPAPEEYGEGKERASGQDCSAQKGTASGACPVCSKTHLGCLGSGNLAPAHRASLWSSELRT